MLMNQINRLGFSMLVSQVFCQIEHEAENGLSILRS